MVIEMQGKNVFVQIYGCTSNKFDSEKMIGLLKESGYRIVSDEDEADYLLINTCAVKSATEEKIVHRLKELSELNKKVIIAGCLTKVNPKRIKETIPNFSAMIDPRSIHKIVDVLGSIDNGNQIIEASETPAEKLTLPRFSFSETISIIKFSEGCLSNCSFCGTKLARGDLHSYRPDIIRDAVKVGVKEGFKEFHLTSEDSSAYGRDIGINLPELLESICRIKGKFFVRVGMMNPLHFKKVEIENLVEIYKNEKIFKFLHLCVQSGSNKVLKDMRRGYTVEEFVGYVELFRKEIPKLTLATDIIVGFPTETEDDFNQTDELIKKVSPNIVNLSKYGPRLGTSAAKMKQLDSKIVTKRSNFLHQLIKKISKKENQHWLGWKGGVLVDEKVKNGFIARNFAYKPIFIEKNLPLGEIIEAKIVETRENFLIGSPII